MKIPQGRRVWAAIAAIAATSLLAVLLVVVATNRTAERVSANAAELHHTNSMLGTAALARSAAFQVAIFQELRASGNASAEAVDAARQELRFVTQSLVSLSDSADQQMKGLLGEYVGALDEAPIVRASVESTYAPVRQGLVADISDIEASIAGSEDSAARVYTFLRVLLMLIIPVGVIVLYRRRAAAQVREAKIEMDAALEAERQIATAKSEFVAGLSHEMKTPLTGIYGYSEILLEAVDDDSIRDMVNEIHVHSVDLARKVDDFITMTRIDSDSVTLHLDTIDAVAVTQSAIDGLGVRDPSIAVTGSPLAVSADAEKVRHILSNLLANALDHGGPTISVAIHEHSGTAVWDVIDDGPTIPASSEERLFTKYVNASADVLTTGSHGLGTWVAAQLAERMGGSLRYERRDGSTVFSLQLPCPDTPDHSIRSSELVTT